MNDRHPSGDSNPADSSQDFSYAPYGTPNEESPYDMYGQQSAQNGYPAAYDGTYGDYAGGDPLFGAPQGSATDTGTYPAYDGYGSYDTYGNYADYGYEQGVQPAGWSGAQDVYAQQGYDGAGYGYADPQSTWDTGTFDAGSYGGGYDTGTYDAAAQATGQFQTGGYETGAWDTGQYDTGQYDAAPYDTGQYATGQFDAGQFQTGQFDAGQFDTGQFSAAGYDTGQYDASQWQAGQEWNTGAWETGQWDTGAQQQEAYAPEPAGSWETDGYEHSVYESYEPAFAEHPAEETAFVPLVSEEGMDATTAMPAVDFDGGSFMPAAGGLENEFDALYAAHQDMPEGDVPEAESPAGVPHPRGGRRRSPKPKRSALMSVAVPSVAVLGVTGVATASVLSGTESDEGAAQAASSPDAAPVKPSKANEKLDSQLAGLSADADDFADRANRTQERLDLQKRQAEERKRKAAEAARKEALRPKFALPVDQKGLSAQFGSAGVNWFSLHSGIDFPVDEGTPVKAATDGTISTKWDISFGNMAIVTAPDGTETWYCHLSSTKIRAGEVKAGDVIGYSGTTGNSTGPHLHFEVHPGGGDAIDPLPWLRGKGLNPA